MVPYKYFAPSGIWSTEVEDKLLSVQNSPQLQATAAGLTDNLWLKYCKIYPKDVTQKDANKKCDVYTYRCLF